MQTEKINITQDYSRFVLDEGNRAFRANGKLAESMRKYGWLPAFPMLCAPSKNGKLFIKDGGHRFEIAKELQLKVHYVCDDTDISIPEVNNAQRGWSGKDFLSCYCTQGKAHYLELRNFHLESGLPLIVCVNLLSGHANTSGGKTSNFRDGSFVIRNLENANRVASVIKTIAFVAPWATHYGFVAALGLCMRISSFKPETFVHKAKTYPGLLKKRTLRDDYLQLIEEIYNHQNREKLPLKFLALEAVPKPGGSKGRNKAK